MYETFRLVQINNGVLWSKCDVPHHHVLYMCDAKRDFARCLLTALNFIRCMIFWKISYQIGTTLWWKIDRSACDCAPPCPKFEVIWTMLGELMVHKVANWGCERWTCMIDSHRTSTLIWQSGLFDKDCLFTFIIFHGQYWTHICHEWRFQKILINLELVMNFGRFGETTVD